MRVILSVGNRKKTYLMLELPDKTTRKKIKLLLDRRKWQEAVSLITVKGKLIKHLTKKDIAHTSSDLILTNSNAYWSLL